MLRENTAAAAIAAVATTHIAAAAAACSRLAVQYGSYSIIMCITHHRLWCAVNEITTTELYCTAVAQLAIYVQKRSPGTKRDNKL